MRRRFRTSAIRLQSLLTLAVLVVAPRTAAQTLGPALALSSRAYDASNTCENAPPSCDGPAEQPGTGVFEFDFYVPDAFWGETDSIRFSLEWPETWTPLNWETCSSVLVSGDPTIPRSGLVFAVDCTYDDMVPYFRLIMDCPTPGRFSMRGYSGGPELEWHACGDDDWMGWWLRRWVEIGDYCGAQPIGPCQMHCFRDLAATFDRDTLRVSLAGGSVASDTLLVMGSLTETTCGGGACSFGIPELHGCFGGLRETIDWLNVALIETDGDYFSYYGVTFDATGLDVGVYDGRLIANFDCYWDCQETCIDVRMVVNSPSPVEGASWTDLKSVYR